MGRIVGAVATAAALAVLLSLQPTPPAGAQRRQSDIFVVRVDGTQRARLTTSEVDETAPAVSRDGRRIAFLRTNSFTTRWDIWVMNANGTGERQLTQRLDVEGPLEWAPDGRTIAFTVWDLSRCGPGDRNCAVTDIWVVPSNGGGGPTRLVPEAQSPRWSPNGRLLLYQDFEPGISASTVSLVSRTGVRGRVLADARLHDARLAPPDWSPTGRAVVYGSGLRPRLFTVRVDGRTDRPLTVGQIPAWSPKGDRIAFARARGIWTIPARGGRPRQVAGHPRWSRFHGLEWAPDGRRLAFFQGSSLYVVAARGRARRVAGPGVGGLGAAWSANGRRLYYAG